MKATELPSFIIKRLPVRFNYNNDYFGDTYQGIPFGEIGSASCRERVLRLF